MSGGARNGPGARRRGRRARLLACSPARLRPAAATSERSGAARARPEQVCGAAPEPLSLPPSPRGRRCRGTAPRAGRGGEGRGARVRSARRPRGPGRGVRAAGPPREAPGGGAREGTVSWGPAKRGERQAGRNAARAQAGGSGARGRGRGSRGGRGPGGDARAARTGGGPGRAAAVARRRRSRGAQSAARPPRSSAAFGETALGLGQISKLREFASPTELAKPCFSFRNQPKERSGSPVEC